MADRFLIHDLQRYFANVFHQVAHRARVGDDGALGAAIQQHVFSKSGQHFCERLLGRFKGFALKPVR